MKKNLEYFTVLSYGFLAALCLALPRAAGALTPSSTDLWDISNGVIITGDSGILNNGGGVYSDNRNMFGGNYGGVEVGNTVFADSSSPGTQWITWQTAAPVTIGNFNLFATDYNTCRNFSTFRLYAGSTLIHTFTPVASFGGVYSADITPVTAQNFRAEFDQGLSGPCGYYATSARIMELDGFAPTAGLTPLAPAFTASSSTTLTAGWTAVSGAEYVAVLASDNGYLHIVSSATQSGNTAVFGGLAPGTSYYFEVKLSTEGDGAFAVNLLSTATLTSTPPVLDWTGEPNYTADGVDPETGFSSTTFTYRVKYADAEGDAPAAGYPRVYILKGGTTAQVLTLEYVSGANNAGAVYSTSTVLPPGADYTYYFEAKDASGAAASGTPTVALDAPDVANNAPVLDWTGEPNYTADGVDPETGVSTNTFTYRVKYTDADNDAPAAGYPKVYILKGGTTAQILTMGYISGSYNTGAVYSASTVLPPGNDYTYHFEVEDVYGGAASGAATAALDAPDVANSAPALDWTGETKYVSDGLDPEIGHTASAFTYRVKYTDIDSDAPAAGYPRVYILKGGTTAQVLTMGYISGSYNTGAVYSTSTVLPVGTDYTYYFEANDTPGAAAAGAPASAVDAPDVAVGPSYTDLWDVSGGAVVTGISGVLNNDSTHWSIKENMFGGTGGVPEPDNTIFADSLTPGTQWITWQTPAPVTLGSFSLFTSDYNECRGFGSFRLYAGSPPALIHTFTPSGVFNGMYSAAVAPVVARDFRAEFDQGASCGLYATSARIMELDGFTAVGATALAPAFTAGSSTTLTAVWTAVSGAGYLAVLASDSGFSTIVSSAVQGGNTAVFGGLAPGTSYYFEVKLSTEADGSFALNRVSTVTLAAVPPVLHLDKTVMDFGLVKKGEEHSASFLITNNGSGVLSGVISADQPWITLSTASFSGNSAVTVYVKPASNGGQYSGTITVTSNGGTTTIQVTVTASCVFTRPNPYRLSSGPPVEFFGSGIVPNSTTINIYTLAGDLVRTLEEKSGLFTIAWDGRNRAGNRVVPGIYLYTTSSPREKNRGSFTVIR